MHDIFKKVETYHFLGFWDVSNFLVQFELVFYPKMGQNRPKKKQLVFNISNIFMVLNCSLMHNIFKKVKTYHFLGFWHVSNFLVQLELVFYPKMGQNRPKQKQLVFNISHIFMVLNCSLMHDIFKKVETYHFLGFWVASNFLVQFELVFHPKWAKIGPNRNSWFSTFRIFLSS